MPAVISTPPPSRLLATSCSYWPRNRKPWERTVAFLSPILFVIQAWYPSLSFRHISHWLALSSNTDSLTIVMNFLKYGLRSGTYPLPSSFGLPTGIAGMVTPSRISHHLGISNEYGISTLPSVSLTSRDSSRSYAFFADSTLRSEPHSISRMAWQTASSVRKDGAILARAPRIRTSVWSSLYTQSPENEALARRSSSL